jgi:hypothetical protein
LHNLSDTLSHALFRLLVQALSPFSTHLCSILSSVIFVFLFSYAFHFVHRDIGASFRHGLFKTHCLESQFKSMQPRIGKTEEPLYQQVLLCRVRHTAICELSPMPCGVLLDLSFSSVLLLN